MLVLGVLLVAAVTEVLPQAIPAESFLTVYVMKPPYPTNLAPYELSRRHLHPNIVQGPVIVLARIGRDNASLQAYYVDNGLRSIADYHNFHPLYQLLRTSGGVSGLLLSHEAFSSNKLLFDSISNFVLPENFRVLDLMREVRFQEVAVLYVAADDVFSEQHFQGLSPLFRLVINDYNIDPVPLVGPGGKAVFRNHLQETRPKVHQNSHSVVGYRPSNQKIKRSKQNII